MSPMLTHLIAREHVNDLLRQAERHRRAAEVTAPRRVRRWIPQRIASLPAPLTRSRDTSNGVQCL